MLTEAQREYNRQYQRTYYQANRERVLARGRERLRDPQAWKLRLEWMRAHRATVDGKQQRREYRLKSEYGLTLEMFNEMLTKQQFKCANPGCNRVEPGGQGQWHVDHNHTTNQVRGILCNGCNTSLGLLGENAERICGLVSYLATGDGQSGPTNI